MARGRSRRAFTILEVLVALAIFAMAAIVLASSYLNILNGYEVAARGLKGDAELSFARSIVLKEADRKKLEQGGDYDSPSGGHVHWSVDIASTNMPDLFTVTFTCEVTDTTQREPDKTVETFTVLRPTWTIDAAEHDKLQQDVKNRILQLQGKQT